MLGVMFHVCNVGTCSYVCILGSVLLIFKRSYVLMKLIVYLNTRSDEKPVGTDRITAFEQNAVYEKWNMKSKKQTKVSRSGVSIEAYHVTYHESANQLRR